MGFLGRNRPRNRVVEIDDFGPITIRALSRKEWEEVRREAGGNEDLQLALVIQAAVVKPEFIELGRLEGRDEAINTLGNAVVDLTRESLLG